MAKTYSKPVPRKSAGRSSTRQRSAPVKFTSKVPSTTNIGTRPSVMPGQPGVPTGGSKISVMPGRPGVPTGGIPRKVAAAPISRAPTPTRLVGGPSTPQITPTMPAPAVNRAAALASNIAKRAANQQVHNAAVRTAVNHPTEISSGPSGGNNGGGFNTGGGGGGATPVTPAVTTPTSPTAPPVTPPVVSTPTTPRPTRVNPFTSSGRGGTYGRFNRQRLNRGPRTGMSITPEMLQRIAAQRIGPT